MNKVIFHVSKSGLIGMNRRGFLNITCIFLVNFCGEISVPILLIQIDKCLSVSIFLRSFTKELFDIYIC